MVFRDRRTFGLRKFDRVTVDLILQTNAKLRIESIMEFGTYSAFFFKSSCYNNIKMDGTELALCVIFLTLKQAPR